MENVKTSMSGAAGRPRRHIWGIGLTRTGTTSLNRALRLLGYGAVHWPTTRQLFYDELDAATDESVAAVFKFLDTRYPGSGFVLTERPEDQWIASTRAQRELFAPRLARIFENASKLGGVWRDRAVELQFTQSTLYGTLEFDEARYRAANRRHQCDVASYFKERHHDLLRLRVCDGAGWDELCAFIGCAVPKTPFPRTNRIMPTSAGSASAKD
jgi:hypothetical protein